MEKQVTGWQPSSSTVASLIVRLIIRLTTVQKQNSLGRRQVARLELGRRARSDEPSHQLLISARRRLT
jgi:hypothetical protein